MFKKTIFFFLVLACTFCGFSQDGSLSSVSKISVLTVGTGEELAAKFGHSAIRVQDPTLGIDEVYGYGTYDFEDPNFYLNFVRGKLAYTISRIPFNYFKYGYIQEQRWIKEQVLNLGIKERNALVAYLENNLQPENRKYKYDFLFDNCATRIPMVFENVVGPELAFKHPHLQNPLTFRQLIRKNLNPNSWSNFGIDLALGAVIDRKATPYEHMFLPIYVYEQLKHTTLKELPLVKQESLLLKVAPREDKALFLLTPAFWLGLLALLVGWVTYKDFKNHTRTKWLDVTLFLITGLAGILILFLWFGTDHLATKENYNALWAFAPNVIIAFYSTKTYLPYWMPKYIQLVILLLLTTCILWALKIQVFSILMPLVLITLALRYVFLLGYFNKQNNESNIKKP